MDYTKYNPMLDISMENISQQFDSRIVKAVREVFEEAKKADSTNTELVLERAIEPLKKFCGLDITIKIDNEYPYNAYVPFTSMALSINNPIFHDSMRCWITDDTGSKIIKKHKILDIQVDMKSGMISGDIVKDIDHEIYMGDGFFKKGTRFSIDEALALFFHELGHLYTYYLKMSTVAVTNFITGEFAETFIGIKSEKTRVLLMKSVDKELGLEILNKERLLKSNDVNEIRTLLFSSQMNDMRKANGQNHYDARGAEALADQFSARMGLALPLATFTAKVYELNGNKFGSYTQWGLSSLFTVWLGINPVVFLLATVSSYYINPLEEIYDNPLKRIEVVKHSMINRLKVRGISREQKEIILKEIKMVDNVLNDNVELVGLFTLFYSHVLPWGRGQHSKIKWQQAMETLSNNNLRVSAERLALLSGE